MCMLNSFLVELINSFYKRRHIGIYRVYADVAQLAEQLICNQQVIGSSPIIGLRL